MPLRSDGPQQHKVNRRPRVGEQLRNKISVFRQHLPLVSSKRSAFDENWNRKSKGPLRTHQVKWIYNLNGGNRMLTVAAFVAESCEKGCFKCFCPMGLFWFYFFWQACWHCNHIRNVKHGIITKAFLTRLIQLFRPFPNAVEILLSRVQSSWRMFFF